MLRGMRHIVFVMIAAAIFSVPLSASAETIANPEFEAVWERTDKPVLDLQVSRTWIWGPEAISPLLQEPYKESPGGMRAVQYFDKGRLEITFPQSDPTSPWYVTSGLLAKEMVTGMRQVGENLFEQHEPVPLNVAGDINDPTGPTYATFTPLMSYAPIPFGWNIIQTVDRSGNVAADPSLASYGVYAAYYAPETKHNIASVFWDFMNSSGPVLVNDSLVTDKLFDPSIYAAGLPLTEAYWTTIKVGGVEKQVLVQVFERRVLTYTPSNPEGWKVESGNVGQHYHAWVYGQVPLP